MMRLFTIGFTKKKAREFFGLLSDSSATALVDTRPRNRSQLAGFAKRDDLEFFLSEICDMHYRQELLLPRQSKRYVTTSTGLCRGSNTPLSTRASWKVARSKRCSVLLTSTRQCSSAQRPLLVVVIGVSPRSIESA